MGGKERHACVGRPLFLRGRPCGPRKPEIGRPILPRARSRQLLSANTMSTHLRRVQPCPHFMSRLYASLEAKWFHVETERAGIVPRRRHHAFADQRLAQRAAGIDATTIVQSSPTPSDSTPWHSQL